MIKQKPFKKYKLDEEKVDEKRITFTVSLNEAEMKLLDHIKRDLDIKSNGKALKEAASSGINVLHNTIGCERLRYLSRGNRTRYSHYVDLDNPNDVKL